MKVARWRQCNIASPSVTATAYGPGVSNGLALTVEVLTGSAITVTGPQYQSSFLCGATASRYATAPARLIPQYTGSLVYGACNRNDAATAWTPAADSTFSQNVSDATNTAAYGTFRSSGTSVPSWSYVAAAGGVVANGTTCTTLSMFPAGAVQDGDLLALYVIGYCAGGAGSVSQASFATQQYGAGSQDAAHVFYVGTRIAASEPTSYTVTFSQPAWAKVIVYALRSSTGVLSVANSAEYNTAPGYTPALPDAALAIATSNDATVYGYGGANATLSGIPGSFTPPAALSNSYGMADSGLCITLGWAVNLASPGGALVGDSYDPTDVALDITPNTSGGTGGGYTTAGTPIVTGPATWHRRRPAGP